MKIKRFQTLISLTYKDNKDHQNQLQLIVNLKTLTQRNLKNLNLLSKILQM